MRLKRFNENFETNDDETEILSLWIERFGNSKPSVQQKMDFYADLRDNGFDGILIFNVLGDRMHENNDGENNDGEDMWKDGADGNIMRIGL